MSINFNQLKTFYNALTYKMKGFRGNWNQNDPTADDYIQNKPFYIDGYVTMVNNKTVETLDDYEQYGNFYLRITAGDIYRVTWDGKVYECTAFFNGECYCLGNWGLTGDADSIGTGEPFFIYYYDAGNHGLFVQNAGNHSISIDKLKVVKIDKKFMPSDIVTEDRISNMIPNNIVTEDDLAPVAKSNNYNDLNNTPTLYNYFTSSYNSLISGYGVADAINRISCVDASDVNYTKYMARGESLNNKETNPTVNGTIAWTYE